ncbi:MAG: hypothetical protein ACE5M4_11635, partial [Anaerolineales bacterium]
MVARHSQKVGRLLAQVRIRVLSLAFLGLLLVAGSACGGRAQGEGESPTATAVTTPRPPAYTETEVVNGGTISGLIKLDGPIPERHIIHVDKDAKLFGETLPDESLLVAEDQTIENVVVF